MIKKKLISVAIIMAILSTGLLYKDLKDKEVISNLEHSDYRFIKSLIEKNKNNIMSRKNVEIFTPGQHAGISTPFCAGKYYFENTHIIQEEEVDRIFSSYIPDEHSGILKKTPEQIWFCNDSTIGILLKSTSGIGFFRDYYHEVVFDPNNRIKEENPDSKCFPTIAVKLLNDNWKYRIISSQWD